METIKNHLKETINCIIFGGNIKLTQNLLEKGFPDLKTFDEMLEHAASVTYQNWKEVNVEQFDSSLESDLINMIEMPILSVIKDQDKVCYWVLQVFADEFANDKVKEEIIKHLKN